MITANEARKLTDQALNDEKRISEVLSSIESAIIENAKYGHNKVRYELDLSKRNISDKGIKKICNELTLNGFSIDGVVDEHRGLKTIVLHIEWGE